MFRRLLISGVVVAIAASVALLGSGTFRLSGTESRLPDGEWVSLFNGEDLSGWYMDKPHHGTWHVDDGVITVEWTDEYKTLLTEGVYGPGTIRAAIIPIHEDTRIGIGYLHPRGPLFMLMGDK